MSSANKTDYAAQYGSLANDAKPSCLENDAEPAITFTNSDHKTLIEIKSSGIYYNREVYYNDTAQRAAQRVYDCIKPLLPGLPQAELNWSLIQWREHPQRVFRITKSGIEHNYDLDLWHSWMMDYLNKLVKR